MTPDMQRMINAARYPFGTESGLSERDAQIAVLAVLSQLFDLSDEVAESCFIAKMSTPFSVQSVVREVVGRVQKDGWP